VRTIDFSYTLRRFELEDQGPLAEVEGPSVLVVSPATEARVRDTLLADAGARRCIEKIADRAEVAALGLEVRIAADGRVEHIDATSAGARCFAKPVRRGMAIDGWSSGAVTVKILVPTHDKAEP
jgi:hypothetical protein